MTKKEFNEQVRTDVKALVNKETELAKVQDLDTTTLTIALTSAMMDASVTSLKAYGTTKSEAKRYTKELLNNIFSDWES